MQLQRWLVLENGQTIEILADRIDDQSDPSLVTFYIADEVVGRFRSPQAWYLSENQPS
jgi:hypothetical protein